MLDCPAKCRTVSNCDMIFVVPPVAYNILVDVMQRVSSAATVF